MARTAVVPEAAFVGVLSALLRHSSQRPTDDALDPLRSYGSAMGRALCAIAVIANGVVSDQIDRRQSFVALARRLTIIMHAMLRNETEFAPA
jgi:hypothetical protein